MLCTVETRGAHAVNPVLLYRRYRTAIFTRCRRLLGSAAEAEDATQEVFIRALGHLEVIPPGHAAGHWLHRTARNYCLNKLRDRRLRDQRTDELGHASVAASTHRRAEDMIVRRDIARRVLALLSPGQRSVAVLYYVDEMDQQEVADTLGISRRTVVNRLAELPQRRGAGRLARTLVASWELSRPDASPSS